MDTTQAGPHKKSEGRLPIMEIFGPTIQGEGAMIGVRTYFIRMGGCDYRCKMCDSMHAVLPSMVNKHAKWLTPEEILEEILTLDMDVAGFKGNHTNWITLSGGNPAMWDCDKLIRLLHTANFKVALETQGSLYQPWVPMCDQITVSPKGPGMGERPLNGLEFQGFFNKPGMYQKIVQDKVAIKVVVFDQRDFEFAVEVGECLRVLGIFSDRCFYLSLGNPYPPVLQPNGTYEDPAELTETLMTLSEHLLRRYQHLMPDYLSDRRLGNWKFLPQLHVLLWSNKVGV